MANTNRIGGIMSLRVDGQQYEARGSFQVTPSATKRTGVAGQDFVHGFIEEPIVPQIAGDISIGNLLSVEDLDAIDEATVQIKLANGRAYVLRSAWTVAGSVIDAHDGKVAVIFEGMECNEL